jgi:hypothetical protein
VVESKDAFRRRGPFVQDLDRRVARFGDVRPVGPCGTIDIAGTTLAEPLLELPPSALRLDDSSDPVVLYLDFERLILVHGFE